MTNLTKILQPYSLEQFLSENWTKRGILIPAEQPNKFQHLFSWKQLNDLLNFHKPDLRFVLDHKDLPSSDPQEWVKRCQEGASLVISHVHEQVPVLADLIWGIQQETGHTAIHTNIYCSWPSNQGFKAHYDTHEVFILQIDGQKEWFVFEDTFKYPYRGEKSEYQKPPEESPYINCVLNPGDLLYIPRGHWHYAIAREKPSLHITLGIRCFTGRDAFEWLLQNLQIDEAWRKNLPLISDGNTHEIKAHVEHLFDSLAILIDREKENLAEKYAEFQPKVTTRAPEISLPSQAGFNFFEQELDTVLRQPKFQKVNIEPLGEKGYLLRTPRKELKFKDLPPKVIETLVEKVFSQKAFTIRDVADWLPECDLDTHILPLLAGLVKEGILVEDSYQGEIREEEKTSLSQEMPGLEENSNSTYAFSHS
ncbi:MAG: hypothetical protein F6K22_07720 [Okeania sp. SIO2F4]|nr:cupin domain-containing protein [Okeania sp. SIO2F4]NES02744.1 hypothetical protein [Okeania sp. SIO2F4]